MSVKGTSSKGGGGRRIALRPLRRGKMEVGEDDEDERMILSAKRRWKKKSFSFAAFLLLLIMFLGTDSASAR